MDAFGTFRLLLDEHSSRILNLIESQPMNATELSEAIGIPIAACYRRLRVLKEAGMIREDGHAVSIGGKLVVTYKSAVDKAEVMLHDGRLKVVIQASGGDRSDEMNLSEGPSMLTWVREKNRPRSVD